MIEVNYQFEDRKLRLNLFGNVLSIAEWADGCWKVCDCRGFQSNNGMFYFPSIGLTRTAIDEISALLKEEERKYNEQFTDTWRIVNIFNHEIATTNYDPRATKNGPGVYWNIASVGDRLERRKRNDGSWVLQDIKGYAVICEIAIRVITIVSTEFFYEPKTGSDGELAKDNFTEIFAGLTLAQQQLSKLSDDNTISTVNYRTNFLLTYLRNRPEFTKMVPELKLNK